MLDEETKAKFALYAGISLTFLGYGARWLGIEPLHNQFFAFAAWSYILLLDNLNFRLRGASLMVSRTGEALAAAAASLAVCCLFELLNLRLGAWHYVNLPSTFSVRWTFRALSWASLLPSVFVTTETFRAAGFFENLRLPRLPAGPGAAKAFFTSGYAALGLALAFPRLFWPLAWPAALLLAEPLNLRLGLPSLLRDWQAGRGARTLRLALAGMTCGLLWQGWLDAGGAKRFFAAFPAGPKLAGLPAAGFAAAAVFALAGYSLCGLASWPRKGASWEEDWWPAPSEGPSPLARALVAAAVAAACWAAFAAADRYSVTAYLGWV